MQRHDHRAPLGAHQDLVLGELEVGHLDLFLVAPRGQQGGLVDEVLEIGAGEARRRARELAYIDVIGKRHLARMDLENSFAAPDVGARHHDAAVEAARAQQRRVEHVGPVGRGDQDYALVGLEAVHLDQQLIERLLALVVAAAQAGAAMASDGVDFIDEDDTGGVLLALHEQVAHSRGAHANEHLDEIRARDRKERHSRLAGDRAGEQRLAGARRPDQQHALGNPSAQAREALGVLEELDYLLELVLGLVDTGDVGESDLMRILGQQLGAALAEGHRLAAADLHLAHEENPHRRPAAASGTTAPAGPSTRGRPRTAWLRSGCSWRAAS